MSISPYLLHLLAAQAAPATMPSAPAPTTLPGATLSIPQALISAGICIAWAALIARLAGVFTSRGRIRTRDRVSPGRGALPLLLVMLLGGGIWLFSQVLYGGYLAARFRIQHPDQSFNPEHLGPYDLAFLSTVPALLGLAVLLVGDRAAGLIRRLGYRLAELLRGILIAIVAAIAVLPLVSGCGILLQLFYQHIHFQHPAEHELLGAMKDATPDVRVILVLGACVIAPIFEELLFRGHLQTLLGAIFTRPESALASRLNEPTIPPAGGAAPPPPNQSFAPPVLDYARSSDSSAEPRRLAWLAILLSSLIFASVHPMWMAPLIFVLALCLGYVYERTGNLWACMALHAIFNTSSTWSFLHMS